MGKTTRIALSAVQICALAVVVAVVGAACTGIGSARRRRPTGRATILVNTIPDWLERDVGTVSTAIDAKVLKPQRTIAG